MRWWKRRHREQEATVDLDERLQPYELPTRQPVRWEDGADAMPFTLDPGVPATPAPPAPGERAAS